MSNLLPDTWSEALKRVHDKVGHFLSKLNPWKKEEQSPERITADTLPAFMQYGGPSLDMHETADELIIRAEVPGLKKDDFTVELVGRRLTITGKKHIVREQKSYDGCLISECRYGSFARTLQLPYEIDDQAIAADLHNGVLTIRFPKPKNSRRTRCKVPVS
jgi:HSP20 family protein